MRSDNHFECLNLNKYAVRIIKGKARRLMRKNIFIEHSIEDLEQEFIYHVIKQLPKFNPVRASLNTFIIRIVDNFAKNLSKKAFYEIDNFYNRAVSLNQEVFDNESNDWCSLEELISQEDCIGFSRKPNPLSDLNVDVRQFVARLSGKDKQICEGLITYTKSQLAQKLDIPRSTLYEEIYKIRDYLTKSNF